MRDSHVYNSYKQNKQKDTLVLNVNRSVSLHRTDSKNSKTNQNYLKQK